VAVHRHNSSSKDVLIRVESYIAQQGGRMTSVRRDIAATMIGLKKSKTAYQILAAVNEGRKTKLSAISVYRTLGFLIDAGVVLKIESKNTFELCLNKKSEHSHLMMVCDKCGNVQEVEDKAFSKSLAKTAQKHGHKLRHNVIELHGVCEGC
jgi:Fur family transcriptional regulator, zinc uptake regulator